MSNSTDLKPLRWRPLIFICVLILVALSIIRIPETISSQMGVIFPTVVTTLIGTLLLLLWFFTFSRLSDKIRLRGLAIIVLCICLFVSLFRVRGFTGDLAPNLEWRWASTEFITGDTPTSLKLWTDYPQFLGPHRNATLPDIVLEPDWIQHPPKRIWRIPVGEAWSAFSVRGRFAVTQEQQNENETVVCYDLLTGKEQWRHKDNARFTHPMGGIGPRATPTLLDNRVYSLGATGILNCLDLRTGRKIWSRNIVKETGARVTDFGMSGSPLILNNRVIVSAGGPDGRSMVAYHKDTGNWIWGGGSQRAAYSSPSLTTLAGIDQILIFNRGQVASHDPLTGKLLWTHPWQSGGSLQHVAQPVPTPGDRVFVSTGYGDGKLLQIARKDRGEFSANTVWQNNRLKAKFTNIVYRDGHIYGLDLGILVCLDLESGRRKWKRGRYGHGQLILVGDLLLIQAESGDIALVEARPDAFQERARIPILDRRTWNNPTFAAPYLIVRNDQEAACYELALKSADESLLRQAGTD